MKKLFLIVTFIVVAIGQSIGQTKHKPIQIIYDTDIDLDVDDVGALALLHALEDNGEAKLLGVICDSPTPYAATTVAAVNEYYGNPEIPIGDMPMEEYVYDKSFAKRYYNYAVNTPFENFNLPMFRKYNTNIKSRKDVWNGVELYRKLLAEAEDKSVVIVAVGLLTVLEDLMYSKPDKYSKLNGKELIAKKVGSLVCMAGDDQPKPNRVDFNWGFEGRGDAERISQQWPSTLVISPLGGNVQTGDRLTKVSPQDNPVRVAYELFLAKKPNRNRSSWDQIAAYYAVRGAGNLFKEDSTKRLDIVNDPLTYTWRSRKANEPQHIRLGQLVSNDELAIIIEDLMIQAPKK